MILDLFAGAGGWDLAAVALGLDPVGIENNDAACATRAAAGLRTAIEGDVRRYQAVGAIAGLIASPPCQTFSMAGKGSGRVALAQVLLGVLHVGRGGEIHYDALDDDRTGLVLEPLRYAVALRPEWIAWEQVPTVQPVWDACADVLREHGYSVWTGVLNAADYGVPQTRKRSLLLASRTREVGKPAPTHAKGGAAGLRPWVSMAEALGWADGEVVSNYGTGGDSTKRGRRSFDQPSATVTSKIDRNKVLISPQSVAGVGHATRQPEEPSVTVTSGFNRARWFTDPASTVMAGHNRSTSEMPNGSGAEAVRITVEDAAVLQSFPPEYPWQGTRVQQFQQIGNAIPPLLAAHVLMEAAGIALPVAAEEAA